jgi:hypothetical protein
MGAMFKVCRNEPPSICFSAARRKRNSACYTSLARPAAEKQKQ